MGNDSPPEMPQRFFEDGHQAFLKRMSAKRKQANGNETDDDFNNPWFFLCGCPTSKVQLRKAGDQPVMEPQESDTKPTSDIFLGNKTNAHDDQAGAPATAARETAAAAASKAAAFEQDHHGGHHISGPSLDGYRSGGDRGSLHEDRWRDAQEFHEEEISPKSQTAVIYS